jgi:chemotaxis protein methyltransferase CheR
MLKLNRDVACLENSKNLEPLGVFLENVAFQKLKKLLQENAGLNCNGYRDEYLKRRFDVRLRATNSGTYSKYLSYLRKNPGEYQLLLNDLTINYTMFLRDFDVYLYLEKVLFPKLFAASAIRIWSAGCATGEEPYSLAILVHEVLGQSLANHHVSIIASDIDKDALEKAARGKYLKKQLHGLSNSIIEKYFMVDGEQFRVKDFVKRIIHFEQQDLMKESLHKSLDLILCRNVMIYFSKESQQKIHMNFFNALRDGGYFITGKSEMLSGEPSRKFQPIDVRCRVYQKPKSADPAVNIGVFHDSTLPSMRVQKA